ncbi:MAG TPA: malto-oligosyltrehalose synthase, partial [Actinomycetota bacterium]|nr:malto-oligosyltrehalose synthase [Actinomycetota bacterium]
VDHTRLNVELGGAPAFERLVAELERHGMGHIVDIVPNHMSVAGHANARWWDVLKNGRASAYAGFFDIDWDSPVHALKGKVLVPILGHALRPLIEVGDIALAVEHEPVVVYHEHRLPLTSRSIEELVTMHGSLEEAVERVNKDPEALERLLDEQNYVLAYWRRAARELNYRRFFDINTLAGLRTEDVWVFSETHGLLLELAVKGEVDGLRIDHIDGLRDPLGYLNNLKTLAGDLYVCVEKILERGEALPDEWPVEGTTGYDFLNRVLGLFVDPGGESALTDFYREFTGASVDLESITHEKKLQIMHEVMPSDITRLLRELAHAFDVNGWPYGAEYLQRALEETIAALPVYRTYVGSDGSKSERDETVIMNAIALAQERCPELGETMFNRLRSILMLESGGRAALDFVLRFQQTTGPVMAKGLEDTVFYNFNRFVALNEVGGDPARFGTTPEEVHAAARIAQERWPRGLLSTATHDTKRGEDARARLAVLSEIPRDWMDAVRVWAEAAADYRAGDLPDKNAEYLFFQTVVGAWPVDAGRMVAYMQKASKEAKSYTSWLDPDPIYDEALEAYVRGVFADQELLRDIARFVERIQRPGRLNSLAQTLVKLTHPGIPDTYQGTEIWDLSLVDPDNRRPVDHAARRFLLTRVLGARPQDLWAYSDDGAVKMLVIHAALKLRRDRPGAFGPAGSYEPLEAVGAQAGHMFGFTRAGEVAVVVPRLVTGTRGTWTDTA